MKRGELFGCSSKGFYSGVESAGLLECFFVEITQDFPDKVRGWGEIVLQSGINFALSSSCLAWSSASEGRWTLS